MRKNMTFFLMMTACMLTSCNSTPEVQIELISLGFLYVFIDILVFIILLSCLHELRELNNVIRSVSYRVNLINKEHNSIIYEMKATNALIERFINNKNKESIVAKNTNPVNVKSENLYGTKKSALTYPYNLKLEEIGLPTHAYNCLKNNKIETLGEICSLTEKELLSLPKLGIGALAQIYGMLKYYGVDIKRQKNERNYKELPPAEL